jgi:hypothetical protein
MALGQSETNTLAFIQKNINYWKMVTLKTSKSFTYVQYWNDSLALLVAINI